MTEHKLIAEARASEFQTDPSLKEVKCGDGNCCPNCGEELN